MSPRLILAAMAAITTACAGTAPSSRSTAAAADAVPKRDRTTIVAEDMETVQALNLYDVVQRLHPEWLRSRSTMTTGQRTGTANTDSEVQVYIDMQRGGTAELLKTLAVRSASAIRYYSASDAQIKFGTGNLNGVIQVITAIK